MIKPFSFTGARRIVFGTGSFAKLAEHIQALKGRRPLVVLDKNLAAAGFQEKVDEVLGQSGLKISFFDKADPEPKLDLADEGARIALKAKCDLVVGIGGGSAMDLAKAVAAGLKQAQVVGRNLAETGAEYVTEESRDVVSKAELEAFHDDVDALRDDVERIAAKIARLQRAATDNGPNA